MSHLIEGVVCSIFYMSFLWFCKMIVSVNVRKSFIFTENEDWKYPVISYFTIYEKVQYEDRLVLF